MQGVAQVYPPKPLDVSSLGFKQGYLERLLDGLLLVHGESTPVRPGSDLHILQQVLFPGFSCVDPQSMLVHAGPC